jgi:hypothetical protein
VLAQIGLLNPAGLPVTGADDSARKVLNPKLPSRVFERPASQQTNPENWLAMIWKVAGRKRCHEEATRTAPMPAEPHGDPGDAADLSIP